MVDARLQRVTENIFLRAGLFPQQRVVIPEPLPREVGTSQRSLILAGTGDVGHKNGSALAASFNGPCGLAVSPTGDLFVCETGNHAVRKIASNGHVSTVAGGRGRLGLNTPTGIAVDRHGTVYVCDTHHDRIMRIETDGTLSVLAGGKEGNLDHRDPLRAQFHLPRGVAVDAAGTLFIAEFRNDAIRRIDHSGVTTVVAQCGGPTALTVAPDGTLYFLATWAGSVVRIEPNGTRSVLANPSQIYGDQGGPGKNAALRAADGICLTPSGLLFADTGNNRVRALAFDEQSTVSTVLGDGEPGTSVGLGSETELYLPRGLTPFNGGYAVADAANHRILWFSA
jgi:sugar lactone lactonase YvrE